MVVEVVEVEDGVAPSDAGDEHAAADASISAAATHRPTTTQTLTVPDRRGRGRRLSGAGPATADRTGDVRMT